jgi:hypothetical protein
MLGYKDSIGQTVSPIGLRLLGETEKERERAEAETDEQYPGSPRGSTQSHNVMAIEIATVADTHRLRMRFLAYSRSPFGSVERSLGLLYLPREKKCPEPSSSLTTARAWLQRHGATELHRIA